MRKRIDAGRATAAPCSEAPTDTRSFIVKLWQEGEPSRSRRACWRGQITSVPGGERVYASSLDELPVLLASQMEESGFRLGWYWRLRLAVNGWGRSWKRKR